MSDWVIWFVIAGVLIGLEIAIGTFYLLMIGVGAAVGGVAALLGLNGAAQCMVAAIVAALATFFLRRARFGKKPVLDANRDPNVNLDVGQTLEIHAWHVIEGAAPTARARYRGALWDIELAAGGQPVAGVFVIREARGSHLIVVNAGSDHL